MYTLKAENKKHEIIELTHNEKDFQVVKVTGLNPPQATINRSSIAGLDGTRFNSSRLEERNIVIYVKLNGDVEANRIKLYQFFVTKEWCKIYYKNKRRDVYIEGYVENVEVDLFSAAEVMQISILCPQSYFKAIDEIIDDVSKVDSLFSFEFSIDYDDPIEFSSIENTRITNVINESESETGLIIDVSIFDSVNKIRIVNVYTGEAFQLTHTFQANDLLTINTNKGEKSVKLLRSGVESNLFSKIAKNSTFFQLSAGDNAFSYLIDDGDNDGKVNIVFKHVTVYRGV